MVAYHPGYRAAGLVVLNNLFSALAARLPAAAALRPLALGPIILAVLDLCEDLGQVTFTLLYDRFGASAPFFAAAVQLASTFNQIKWLFVRTASAIAAAAVVVLVVTLAVGAIRGGNSSTQGDTGKK